MTETVHLKADLMIACPYDIMISILIKKNMCKVTSYCFPFYFKILEYFKREGLLELAEMVKYF
jgi:hypothetical protein